MRCRGVIAFMALCFGLTLQSMPADAQHHASKQKAQRPKSDAELIASATSAAPQAMAKDATIVAVGSDGKLRTLRQGQGAFTCVPNDPNTPGQRPDVLGPKRLGVVQGTVGA